MAGKAQIEDIFSLAPLQEGLLFEHLRQPDSTAYFQQHTFRLRGKLDTEKMEHCFQLLLQRHTVLRSVFRFEKVERPLQVVLRERKLRFTHTDLSALPAQVREERLLQIGDEDRQKKFDLQRDLLIRFHLITLSVDEWVLIFSHPHILLDGWCTGILFSEFLQLYQQATPSAEELPVISPYALYAKWLQAQPEDRAMEFWTTTLNEVVPTALPQFRSGQTRSAKKESRAFSFSPALSAQLSALASQLEVTTGHLAHALWGLWLMAQTNGRDVVAGTVVSGRPAEVPGIEGMLGLFINTIPLRMKTTADASFTEFVKSVQTAFLNSEPHQHLSLTQVQVCSEIQTPLFDHILILENTPAYDSGETLPFEIRSAETREQTHYALDVTLNLETEWRFLYSFDPEFWSAATIENWFAQLGVLAAQVCIRPQSQIRELQVLSPADHEKLNQWGKGPLREYPTASVPALFAKWVEKKSDHPALEWETGSMSYAELDAAAEQAAQFILSQRPGCKRIAVMLPRTPELIISLLACWKAGCAYVLIDPAYPVERIRYLIQNCQADLLIQSGSLSMNETGFPPSLFPEDWKSFQPARPLIPAAVHAEEEAYLIYTSGSTGNPKGVSVSHLSLSNLAFALAEEYRLTEFEVRLLTLASVSFDVFTGDLARVWSCGGTLLLCSEEDRRDPHQLLRWITDKKANCFEGTPALLVPLLQMALQSQSALSHLRLALFGGDIVSAADWDALREQLPAHIRLTNGYGVTEATIDSCFFEGRRNEQLHGSRVPVGHLLPNVNAYILDDQLNRLPPGVTGELYLSGLSIALGYPMASAESEAKFLPDPFVPGQRMYRTGDLMRWLPDGNLDFVGRNDAQFKVRGFRIEPGEVEAALKQATGSQQVLAMVTESAEPRRLLAFYTGPEAETESLRRALAALLPAHALPDSIIHLEAFPLTANGKTDRKALLSKIPAEGQKKNAEAPQGDTEAWIASLFAELLSVKNAGRHDSFFELGGNSISAIRLISKIQLQKSLTLTLPDLFAAPTVSGIAHSLSGSTVAAKQDSPVLEKAAEAADYALSPAQYRLWLVHQIQGSSREYHISKSFPIEAGWTFAEVEGALQLLSTRHEVLRTAIVMREGQPRQQIRADWQFSLPKAIAANESEVKGLLRHEAQADFVMEGAILWRAKWIEAPQGKVWLSLVMHHLISDGWSLNLLQAEMLQLMEAKRSGGEAQLPSLPFRYVDYAEWQQRSSLSGLWKRSRDYWLRQFSGDLPAMDFPADENADTSGSSKVFTQLIPHSVVEESRQLASKAKASLFAVLLAAFKIILSRKLDSADTIVGTPSSGRKDERLRHLAGCFLNTLMIRTVQNPAMNGLQWIQEVQSQLSHALEHEHFPFEEWVNELKLPLRADRFPASGIFLNFLNYEPGKNKTSGPIETGHRETGKALKFDLNIYLAEYEEGLLVEAEYKGSVFSSAFIEKMVSEWVQLISQLSRLPHTPLPELDAGNNSEQSKAEAKHASWYHPDQSLSSRFEAVCQAHPGLMAAPDFTYSLLESESRKIAGKLAKQLPAGSRVGVVLPHSPQLAPVLWGIIRAGMTWVPLDRELPPEVIQSRIAYLQITACISLGEWKEELQAVLPAVQVFTEEDFSAVLETISLPVLAPETQAYLLFTSGSTGSPKAVPQTHGGLLNFISAYSSALNLNETDRLSGFSPLHYDSFLNDFFGAHLNGGEWVPLQATESLQTENGEWLKTLSVLHVVPALWRQLAAVHGKALQQSQIRILKMSGEASRPADFYLFRLALPSHCRFVVSYGATEATLLAIESYSHESAVGSLALSPGFAAGDAQIEIVQATGRKAGLREPGEIRVHAPGLFTGYWNQPEKNARVLLYENGKRWFRTGDQGWWRMDGRLQIAGRLDAQVKVSGVRIDATVVESAMMQTGWCRECAVVARAEVLTAFYCSGNEVAQNQWVKHLSEVLPPSHVPTRFIHLHNLPTTATGKIRRQALTAFEEPLQAKEFVQPLPGPETKAAEIWAQFLPGKKVSRHDHFFELGGNSLIAARVTAAWMKETQSEVSLRTLFQHPVLSEWVQALGKPTEQSGPAPVHAPMQEWHTLSWSQQRLWVLCQLPGSSGAYHLCRSFLLRGRFDRALLQAGLDQLVQHHASLRTTFHWKENIAFQRIHAQMQVLIEHNESPGRPFDLESGPLLRMMTHEFGDENLQLTFEIHHLISDAWTMELLLKDWMQAVQSLSLKNGQKEESASWQYVDYAAWQRDWMQSESGKAAEAFWKKQLGENLPVVDWPADFERPLQKDYEGRSLSTEIPAETVFRFEQWLGQQDATLFNGLLALVRLLLHQYTGAQDILTGSPVAGRNRAEWEGIAGFFVNTLVIRAPMKPLGSFKDQLAEVKSATEAALVHADWPFDKLVQDLAPARDAGRNPFFETMVALQNVERSRAAAFPDLPFSAEEMDEPGNHAKFDLTFYFTEQDGPLRLVTEFATALFRPETIRRMQSQLLHLMEVVCARPEVPIALLPTLEETEWNDHFPLVSGGVASASTGDTLLNHWEAQVQSQGTEIALEIGSVKWSREELDEVANGFALALQNQGFLKGEVAAVALPRGLHRIAALLGVMKAGGIYVPLPLSLPDSRMQFLLEDSGAKWLLLNKETRLRAAENLHSVFAEDIKLTSVSALKSVQIEENDAVCFIYTSGTTGKPKATLPSHRNLMRIVSQPAFAGDVQNGRMLQHAAFAFDASLWETFFALCNGLSLVLTTEEQSREPREVAKTIEEHGVTHAFFTTPFFNLMAKQEASSLGQLRKVFFGGERASAEAVGLAFAQTGPGRLVHLYGPSETAVLATAFEIQQWHGELKQVPIGKALPGTKLCLLNEWLQAVPPGAEGEICIAGPAVTSGYFNQAEQTRHKFISNPLSVDETDRVLYRSGDLGRWLPDGNLVFTRRKDQQLKFRGYRIEPEEIERCLLSLPGVQQARVKGVDTETGTQLRAWVQGSLSDMEIKNGLTSQLPEYMVPHSIISVQEWPLTASGKTDESQLLAMAPAPAAIQGEEMNEWQQCMARLWGSTLGLPQVNLRTHFFESGGHSLLAVQITHRIRSEMQIEAGLQDLYAHPVLEDFCAQVFPGSNAGGLLPTAPEMEWHPLTSAQAGIWSLQQLRGAQHVFELHLPMQLSGALDVSKLKYAIEQLVHRHESLRSLFKDSPEGPRQHILKSIDLNAHFKVSEVPSTEWVDSGLLLSQPLWKAELSVLGANQWQLHLCIHHLIADGWSLRILFRDLWALYAGTTALPPVQVQMKDLAHAEAMASPSASWWEARLAGANVRASLPLDFPLPAVKTFEGASYSFSLSPEQTKFILYQARSMNVSPFAYCLTAWGRLLAAWTHESDLLTGTAEAGRSQRGSANTVGNWAQLAAVPASREAHLPFAAHAQLLQRFLIEGLPHFAYPFDQLVQDLKAPREASRSPLFESGFTWTQLDAGELDAASEPVPGLQVKMKERGELPARHQLWLFGRVTDDSLVFSFVYNRGLFKSETIEGLSEALRKILSQDEVVKAVADESAGIDMEW